MTVNGVPALMPAVGKQAEAAKLKDATRQFEALLIGQMLKSVRESGGGWMGAGEDESAAAAVGMAEEQLAQTLAAQGGLGLAKMIVFEK